MAQLEQWKKNNGKSNETKIGPVKGNKLNIEPVKSAVKLKFEKNCERNCETAKRSKTQRTLDNTGFIKRNCETGCGFAKSQNSSVNRPKIGEIKNTQGNERSAPKAKYQGKLSFNPLAFKYNQLNRQFSLINGSIIRCLECCPDDFHHKLKMRNEFTDIIDRIKSGESLLNKWASSFLLDSIQQKQLKRFNDLASYLICKLTESVGVVDELNAKRGK